MKRRPMLIGFVQFGKHPIIEIPEYENAKIKQNITASLEGDSKGWAEALANKDPPFATKFFIATCPAIGPIYICSPIPSILVKENVPRKSCGRPQLISVTAANRENGNRINNKALRKSS